MDIVHLEFNFIYIKNKYIDLLSLACFLNFYGSRYQKWSSYHQEPKVRLDSRLISDAESMGKWSVASQNFQLRPNQILQGRRWSIPNHQFKDKELIPTPNIWPSNLSQLSRWNVSKTNTQQKSSIDISHNSKPFRLQVYIV